MSTSERRDGGIHLSRRQLLVTGAAGGLSLTALVPGSSIAFGATTPKRGGTLQVGLVGGSAASEQLDPNTSTVSSLDLARHQNVFSKLADFDAKGKVYPQLAASFEPNKSATSWTIKLKQGVTWHDGSPLTADDVVYSLQRVLDPANKLSSASGNLTMVDPSKIVKVDATTLTIGLKQPWSDLPTQLGQRYLAIVKNGTKTFTADTLVGTGPFKLAGWTAGTQTTLKAYSGYFESGKPYLDTVVLNGIDDPTARLNALLSGQVQAMEFVDPSQIKVLKASSSAMPLISTGGGWTPIVMNTKVGPFRDVRVRQAMKLLADRTKLVKVAEQGFASVGNDLFAIHDPLYNSSLGRRKYDPEKAKFLLKQAGHSDLKVTLDSSQATPDMLSSALLFAQSAKAGGVKVTVKKHPVDSFWSAVYGKSAFTHSSWGYRPFFPQWLQSFQAFNKEETNWTNAKANKLVQQAVATVDDAKRTDLAHQAQAIQWKEGGYIIWGFQQRLDGVSKSVQGLKPSPINPLGWYGFKDAWLS
ncbi:MAG: peptide/nickel transport system substrate-binding protein [Gaiellales bacterium]|nr:peptide/nickel transport system substrate-binding protein [Gaiellales bacterium]